jgi:putative transposase
MTDMMMVFACLNQGLDSTALRQLMVIAQAMLAMTGRVTMLGLSRWAGKGGSYRTIQRFFNTSVTWPMLQWLLIRTHLWKPGETMVAAGDDVIVTKSGRCTHGLDRFFSSIYSKVVPGLGFLSLSLISVERRVSYPMVVEQLEQTPSRKTQVPSQPKRPGQVGRPKGRKNGNRHDVELSPYLQFVQAHLKHVLELIGSHIQLEHFVFDGAFGNNDAVQMVRQLGLHLISKLRHDSALYLPYTGPYLGRGPRKKYGAKINYHDIPERYLKSSSLDKAKSIETKIYQIQAWHKKFADLLNIVVIVKRNLKTNKVAHVILFSSDLNLSYEVLIDYYSLRFQIEFNFRDAKQHWGLEDFMVVNKTPVYNSANLAMFMVNVSQALMRPMRAQWPELSVNDLKTWFRSRKYVVETLKLLPEMPEAIFIDEAIAQVAQLGRINHAENPV